MVSIDTESLLAFSILFLDLEPVLTEGGYSNTAIIILFFINTSFV